MSRAVIVFCVIIFLLSGRMECSKFSAITGVDEKWHKSDDGSLFYIDSEQKFNWFDAWNECARRNMSLIAIDSYRKHLQIDALIKKIFPTSCPLLWLGGHDNAIDLRYEWATTGEVFSFTNWGSSEPGRSANEHCISMSSTYQWLDLTCLSKVGFICEENVFNKKFETLKQECQEKTNGLSKFKNAVMHFNVSPSFGYMN